MVAILKDKKQRIFVFILVKFNYNLIITIIEVKIIIKLKVILRYTNVLHLDLIKIVVVNIMSTVFFKIILQLVLSIKLFYGQ